MLAVGCWLLGVGRWLVACCLLLVACCCFCFYLTSRYLLSLSPSPSPSLSLPIAPCSLPLASLARPTPKKKLASLRQLPLANTTPSATPSTTPSATPTQSKKVPSPDFARLGVGWFLALRPRALRTRSTRALRIARSASRALPHALPPNALPHIALPHTNMGT
jgi:hypothetical protein